MRKFTAQFRIVDELLNAGKSSDNESDITESILQRLRNHTAIFDKIIEDDGDDNVQVQLHDHQNMGTSSNAATNVDITLSVEDSVFEILLKEPDLVFVKVISELGNGNVKLVGNTVKNKVGYISYE